MKNTYRFSLVHLSCLYLLFIGNVLLAQSPILAPPPSIGSTSNKKSVPNLLTIQSNPFASEIQQAKVTPIEIVNQTIWDGATWSNGAPDAFTRAVINANYTPTDILDVYDITIKDGATVTLGDGVLLKSKQFLSKEIKDKIIMQENSGTLSKLPNTTLSVFDRNNGRVNQYSSMFMSSPVMGQTIGDTFTTVGTLDVSHAYRQHNGAGQIAESFVMLPGNGYIETTNGNGIIPAAVRIDPYNHKYTGTENTNNNYPVSVINGYNLVGNPYASSLDADSFLLDNTAASCIFLWTRNTLASSLVEGDDVYNFSTLDYAMYNVLGGINAGRNITLNSRAPIGTTLVPFSERENYDIPDGKIHFGTSFYLRTSSAGTVTFKNTMTTSPSGQIFRHSSNRLTNTALITPPTRSRIWINLSEGNSFIQNSGRYRQALIGYATGATTGGTDRLFDAEPLNHFTHVPLIDIYSFAPSSTTKLSIQGRDNFQGTDSFQLGYKVKDAGNYTFATTHDGIFNSKPYYILDALDGQYHTLPFTFTTAAGTFDTRFKVVFENLISFVSNPIVCGTILTDIDYPAFAQNIPSVTTYKYEVRTVAAWPGGNLFGEFNAPNLLLPYRFTLNLSGITYNNTIYYLRVATYQINGVWQYGPTCTVTTPLNPPKSYLQPANCNSTITSYSTTIRAQVISAVGINAAQYRFNVTVGGNTYQYTAPPSIPSDQFNRCNLRSNFVPSGMPLTPNTTYSFTVDVLWDNNWQIGTQICTVTTSSNPTTRNSETDFAIFEATAYPNPFANNFKLDINTSSEEQIELQVFDMLGRQIESRSINISSLDTQEIGETYTSGVYNVIIKQGDKIKTLHMIKR